MKMVYSGKFGAYRQKDGKYSMDIDISHQIV